MSARVAYPTAGGELQIEFGVNRWVLVETPDGQSEQQQVSSQGELASLIRSLGTTEADARVAAREAWSKRPVGAGTPTARPSESLRRSMGLSRWKFGAVIGLFIAVWAALLLIVFTGR